LRADGFIIRAQATIRTGEFFVRAGFGNSCAAQATATAARRKRLQQLRATRANPVCFVRIHTIRTKQTGFLELTECFAS
jgi:hypothetical protein